MRILTFAGVLLFSALESQAACPELEPWLQVKQQAHSAATLGARSQAAEKEFSLRREAASALFESFRNGTFDRETLDRCLSEVPDRQNFYNTFQTVFFEKSMAQLRSARSPKLSRFAALIDSRTQDGRTIPFRLTGHAEEKAPVELKGGFHRGMGSIFMDIGRVRPDEWMIVFIHEMAHGLDDEIPKAMRGYAQKKEVEEFAAWALRTSNPEDLPRETRKLLDRWLEAGLGRGLFAEYRAWLVTLVLYDEGLREGLWGEIPWMDAIRRQKPSDQNLALFIYLYLDQRFEDPTNGIFSRELIQNALRGIRARYRDEGILPELGILGRVVD